MDLLWPGFLALLALPPLLVAVYIWVLRRRRRFAVRYSSLALVRAALPRQAQWRRHVPFALLLLALASLIGALSRPVAVVQVPSGEATIILAMDVSRSMCATDIAPSRLAAAKTAALSFIDNQAPNTQMGLVAFAGFSALIQAPTADQALLQDAVRGLTTGRGTAIGSGILESLNAIAEINDDIEPVTGPLTTLATEPGTVVEYAPEIIVVLTDGVTTTGIPPLEAAEQAAVRGIRIYTIGFGTAGGGSGSVCGGQGFGFGGGGGGNFRRGIDEPTLIQVAEMTGGDYYSAESAGELEEVFQSLPASFSTRPQTTEITFAFTALGALLALAAMALGLLWMPAV